MRRALGQTLILWSIALAMGATGCGGAGTGSDSGVGGEFLTNPDPGPGTDGTLVPFLPPDDPHELDEPIPTTPPVGDGGSDPTGDSGLSVDGGETGFGGGFGGGFGEDPEVVIDIEVPVGGTVDLDLYGGSSSSGTGLEVMGSTGGSGFAPGFGDEGLAFDEQGSLHISLQRAWPGFSGYLMITTYDAQGVATNAGVRFDLPPGWILDLQLLGPQG